MVSDIECIDIDGQPVAVSTSRDGDVRVWNLDVVITGGVPARPGHTEPINAVACAVVDGQVVIVAGGGEHDSRQDGVAVWNLADGTPVGTRFGAGSGWVTAIATVIIDDTAVAVLATGHTNQLQLWNIADGTPRGGLRGHRDTVHAVAAATIGGRPLVISGGMDGMPRVWDLTGGSHVVLSEDDPSHDVQSAAIGDDVGVPYAATWSDGDVEFVVWDIARRVERCRVALGFRCGWWHARAWTGIRWSSPPARDWEYSTRGPAPACAPLRRRRAGTRATCRAA